MSFMVVHGVAPVQFFGEKMTVEPERSASESGQHFVQVVVAELCFLRSKLITHPRHFGELESV